MSSARSVHPRRRFLAVATAVVVAAAVLGTLAVARLAYSKFKLIPTGIERVVKAEEPGWASAQPRILVIGDSRAARWPLGGGTTASAPLAIAGVGGETTGQLVARQIRETPAPRGTIVLVMSGINDLVAAELNPDSAPAIEAAAVRNIMAVAVRARTSGGRVMIAAIGQPANIGWDKRALGMSPRLHGRVDKVNARLQAAAGEGGFGWLDLNNTFGVGSDRRMPASLAADTLHWNAAAYRLIERALPAAFESLPE